MKLAKGIQPSYETIESRISVIRDQRVILDSDLAALYGVETRALNQAVKRHLKKFPIEFMFRLTPDEARQWSRSRSQIVILKRGLNRKYCPNAFTEHGVIMAANILRTPRADQMSVFVVRAFIRMRGLLESHKELSLKLSALETKYDSQFKVVFDAIRELMEKPAVEPPKIKGFTPEY